MGFLDSGGGDGWDLLSPEQQALLENDDSDPTRTVHPAGAADTHTTGAGA